MKLLIFIYKQASVLSGITFSFNQWQKQQRIVTGANKGIGYEVVRQLASNGVTVVLTARDEKRGLEAVEKLKQSGYGNVLFHQLDVTDPASIHSLPQFIKSQFGKLDILVNNAGISGVSLDGDDVSGTVKVNNAGTGGVILEGDNFSGVVKDGVPIKWYEMATQTYELTEKCLHTNYYGTKRVCEALVPLLQLSDSPRIVNVSSSWGKLKVNNAGIVGAVADPDAFLSAVELCGGDWPHGEHVNWDKIITAQPYEMAKECLNTNYYGAKKMSEAFVPLLQLSDSPRIVNVSSHLGKLELIPGEWNRGVLSDVERLTEERVDELLNKFLQDLKEGSLEKQGWPTHVSAYYISKAALNAYTRLQAQKYPAFLVNCVGPGYVKTDINCNTGSSTPAEGAASVVSLALLPNDGPSGFFFSKNEVTCF